MLLSPKKWKYRKQMRWRITWMAMRWNTVAFWDYWMKLETSCYITNRQLESARKVIIRYVRKIWKMWIRMFPDVPYTTHGLELPMGKGKGDVETYRIRAKRGKILFEVSWVPKEVAQEAFRQASYKLPCSTRTVERNELK